MDKRSVMADKRYYWLKLKENYFDSPKIKKLRKIAGGDTYTIIYLKLQLLSIKNNGIIEYEKIEPTFQEELALKLDEDVENISVTLSYLQAQGLVDVNENNDFFLIEASNNIGSESESAERVRLFRERKNQIALQCNDSVTEVKQISISNSNSNSNSNSTSNSTSNNKDKKDSEIEQEFEEVWKIYPRKEDKKKAFLAYKTARKKASFDEIKKGVETYSNHIKASNTDKRYIKLGATYFNGECWANNYEQSVPKEELIKGKYTRAQVEEFAKQLNISYEKALECC